jgi:hypothetical protein
MSASIRVDHFRHIDLNDEVRWWLSGEIEAQFAPNRRHMLDVKAGIGLEPTGHILTFKGRRACIFKVQVETRSHRLKKRGQKAFEPFVLIGGCQTVSTLTPEKSWRAGRQLL